MTLVRGLRKWDLVALVINNVIGAGIFGLPSQVYALAGTLSLVAYAVAALGIGLVVLCFAEVGSRFGATGGPYLYTRVAFGPLIGFQVGWLMWIARLAGFAALTNLFVTYLAFFVPDVGIGTWRAATIVLIAVILSTVNIIGLRASARVTNVLTIGKVSALLVFVAVGLFFVDPNRQASTIAPSYGSFSRGTLLLLYAYGGFEGAVIPGGEMRDPRQHLPFALLLGMSAVAVLYSGVQAVCIGTVPDLAHASRPLADAAFHIVGRGGEALIAAVALISIGGILNATTFATSRLPFAIAENGELPGMFARTHVRFQTPIGAIVTTTMIGATFALFTTFISALTIATIVRLVAYMVTCAALPVLRHRTELPQSSFSTPAGPLVASGAIALGVWLLSNTTWAELRLSVLAVIVGMVIYFACARRTHAPQAAVLSSRPS